MGHHWTPERILALGVTTDVVTAGSIFDMGRDTARRLARTGEFPCPVIKTGVSRHVVPVAGILRALGLNDEDGAGIQPAPPHLIVTPATAKRSGGTGAA